jgi:response regulator RpfG family c-di-GMP phosphodiesterase/ribosomal protein L17
VPSITEQPTPQGNIMVVDDNPANLKLLEDMLRKQRYEVRSFPLGRLALAAAEQEPPDLILLDINMPEINGYEVCERLKSSARLSDIPVIFISALNATEDKVKGFRSGGADYVSKPFQFEEVQARVETHLKLRRAQQAERDLLERTLGGAVGTLLELVQITSPVLVLRSHSIRDIILWITKRLELKEAWQYELAAMLCLVGCIVLPNEIFEKAYGGQDLSPEEDQIFRDHPESAARLLSNIPRLEAVAEMIRGQLRPDAELSLTEPARQGAHMLHLALELDRKIYQDIDCRSAIAQLRGLGRFNGSMLDALDNYTPTKVEFEVRQLMIRELRTSMVVDEDIVTTKTKTLVFKEGMVLTYTWIERLGNFARTQGLQERIRVRIPRLANIGKLSKLGYGLSGTGVKRA